MGYKKKKFDKIKTIIRKLKINQNFDAFIHLTLVLALLQLWYSSISKRMFNYGAI